MEQREEMPRVKDGVDSDIMKRLIDIGIVLNIVVYDNEDTTNKLTIRLLGLMKMIARSQFGQRLDTFYVSEYPDTLWNQWTLRRPKYQIISWW